MKNMKKAYLAPMVEVMNARVEKGFAGSGSGSSTGGGNGMIYPDWDAPFASQSHNPDFD